MFACQFCDRPYTRKTNLDAHIKAVHANEQMISVEGNAKRRIDDGGGETLVKERKIEEKRFKCRFCENTYARKYIRDLHQKLTHEGDVRDTPTRLVGGGGEQQRSHLLQVRSILSSQTQEKANRAKKSILIYKIRNIYSVNTHQLPNINTQLLEIEERFINTIFDQSQQNNQGSKYTMVMELVFTRLMMDKQRYEWMYQPAIDNSKMLELVYGT